MVEEHERIRTSRLPNGVLVLTEQMPEVESVAVGIWADAGSVDEAEDEFGQAHYLEHMLFKGTQTRSAFALAEEIEDVGGQINAYTERETTHVFGRVLAEHLPVLVDLLADMVCRSTFPQDEFDRERQVILEEIRKYESLPDERIHDLIMEGLWHGGGLGHPILGTEESINALTRDQLVACWQRHFSTDRVLISAAGKLDHDEFVHLAAQHFADLPAARVAWPALSPGERLPYMLVEDSDEEQVNFCWGGRTYAAGDERNFPLAMIDATLGASTTSRLFQEIREKRGLAYDVSSFTVAFRETGCMCASGACGPETFPRVLELVRDETERLRRDGMTERELVRAKEQMKSGMALALENSEERMRRLANHYLTWDAVYPLRYLINRVDAVTMNDIHEILHDAIDLSQWTFAAIGPFDPRVVRQIVGVES